MISTANVPKVDRVAQQGIATISQRQTNNVPQARFTWKIVNFSTLRKREICSDPFEFGGYKWRLIIFPKGGNETCLSIYLEVADSATLPHGWRIDTQFGLAVINQTNNKLTVRTEAQHEFYASESDWGFPSFMPLRELNDSSRGFLVNDSCIIEADVAANLFTIVKVARDADFVEQIGKDVYFDLVDFESIRSFHIKKQMPFYLFKEKVAKEFGIPVQSQRFWIWARRMNETFRPFRPLTSEEETYTVEKLRNVRNKTQMGELKLFLEVEFGLDQSHVPPPHKTEKDILLFLKLYDPKTKELRYIGRLFVNCHCKVSQIMSKVNLMAGFDPDEDIKFYEEIKYKPFVMCEPIDDKVSWRKNEIGDGDIIYFQKASSHEKEQYQYPSVPSFLNYVHSRQEKDFAGIDDDQAPDMSVIKEVIKSRFKSLFDKIKLDSQSNKLEDLQVTNKSLSIAKAEAENALKVAEKKASDDEAKIAFYKYVVIQLLLQEKDLARIDDQTPDMSVKQVLTSRLKSLFEKIKLDSQSKKLEDLQVTNKSLSIAKAETENALKAAEKKASDDEAKIAALEAELEELRAENLSWKVQIKAKEEELVQEKTLRMCEVDDVCQKAREKAIEELGAEGWLFC